jgi:hypothetical protein
LVLQDISRRALGSDFAREYEKARAAEHYEDESAAIVPSRRTMRHYDTSLRGNVVDISARDTDVR